VSDIKLPPISSKAATVRIGFCICWMNGNLL
jgi:hypothetical protein